MLGRATPGATQYIRSAKGSALGRGAGVPQAGYGGHMLGVGAMKIGYRKWGEAGRERHVGLRSSMAGGGWSDGATWGGRVGVGSDSAGYSKRC